MTDSQADNPKPDRNRLADLAVLFILAGLAATYAIDAYRASAHILNLILVLPVTVIVLLLCAIQFVVAAPRIREPDNEAEPVRQILPVMLLFVAYVISLEWLGFDVGTFIFIAAFLWLHGERRWPWVIGYALAFATLLALFFSMMLPYPMPMLVLETAY